MATFYGAPVDWQGGLDRALELMGLRSTDMGQLHRSFALLYLHAPEEGAEKYGLVLQMITRRMFYMGLTP